MSQDVNFSTQPCDLPRGFKRTAAGNEVFVFYRREKVRMFGVNADVNETHVGFCVMWEFHEYEDKSDLTLI